MMLIGKQHKGSDKETGMKRIIHALFMLLILSSLFSCQPKEPENIPVYRYDKYIDDNFDQYSHIRDQLIDTLNSWRHDSLENIHYIFYDDEWQIDSILLFNKDSTRFYTTLNQRHIRSNSRSDFIKGMAGIKKENQWYFQLGGNYLVGRQRQKEQYEPQTFEELSYISHSRMMSRFLKVDEKGNYTVDYDELHTYFYKSFRSSYPDVEKIDSLILTRIATYHKKKIDPKTIERVKESRKNSVRPPEVPKPKKSLIRRLFEEEEKTPLFETEEWKNRRKNNDKHHAPSSADGAN